MKKLYTFLFIALTLASCEEDEPFEYPDDPIETDPVIINHAERAMRPGTFDQWDVFREVDSCPSQGADPALWEFDSLQNEFLLHLIPNDTACDLMLEVNTDFLPEEISTDSWVDLNFEFFFSEYLSNPNTELWLSFYYKNLELDLNLVQVINDLGVGGGNDGSVMVSTDTAGLSVRYNGVRINSLFDAGDGNRLSTSGSGTNNHFSLRLEAEGTDQQSLMLFKYLRVYSIGRRQ